LSELGVVASHHAIAIMAAIKLSGISHHHM
jgi:hypothetical protein